MKRAFLLLAVAALVVSAGVSAAQQKAPATPKTAKADGGGQVFKDSWLTSKTKMALIGDKRVKARRITVETQGGVVMLRGKVGSAEERGAAEQIARGISGVKSVSNLLQVVPEAQRDRVDAKDADIKKAAYARLDADERLKAADIKVRSDNGTVTLMGSVPDAQARARAGDLVGKVPGVRSVRNELR